MSRMVWGLLLFAAALPLQADTIYRWVDKDGGVHFSATPPPGQAVQEEDLHFQPNADPAAAAEANARRQQDIERRREEQARAAQLAAQNREKATASRERCEQARGIISRLQGARGVRYKQDDGSYRMYSDAEWQQKMEAARKAEQESCG